MSNFGVNSQKHAEARFSPLSSFVYTQKHVLSCIDRKSWTQRASSAGSAASPGGKGRVPACARRCADRHGCLRAEPMAGIETTVSFGLASALVNFEIIKNVPSSTITKRCLSCGSQTKRLEISSDLIQDVQLLLGGHLGRVAKTQDQLRPEGLPARRPLSIAKALRGSGR